MIDSEQLTQRKQIIDTIRKAIPRHQLYDNLTPLTPTWNVLQSDDAPKLWFKRDDLIGFGMGGNKIRGLEIILADALSTGADTLVTGAGAQSNHVRASAATAAHAGLACTAVYWGTEPEYTDGNYRITKILNADIHFTGSDDRTSVDSTILEYAESLRKNGARPYPIPRGGACPHGVLGHVLAVFELYEQCIEQRLQPEAIVMAVGSGGTYAGWLIGIRLLELPWKIYGYSVSRRADEISIQAANLATQASQLLKLDWQFGPKDAPINCDFIGPGYGLPSSDGAEAIRMIAVTEGILLDPTYTGKAMAGYLHDIRKRKISPDSDMIFLHTGGQPAFFAGDGAWLYSNI